VKVDTFGIKRALDEKISACKRKSIFLTCYGIYIANEISQHYTFLHISQVNLHATHRLTFHIIGIVVENGLFETAHHIHIFPFSQDEKRNFNYSKQIVLP